MLIALNAWSLSSITSTAEQILAAGKAGFGGIELTIAAEGPLRFNSSLDECRSLARQAADLGLKITSLASGAYFQTHFASASESDRARARDMVRMSLDRAAELTAAAVVVIPAVVGRAQDTTPGCRYSDAYRHTLDALTELRRDAEDRAVALAIENVWNRFLLSPLEAADLVDHVNSPSVGWCFDTGNVLATGFPQDWLRELAGRTVLIHAKDYDLARPGRAGFCPLGEGSVNWPEVMNAIRDVNYTGPLVYEGGGDPAEMCRRLTRIVAGRPPIDPITAAADEIRP